MRSRPQQQPRFPRHDNPYLHVPRQPLLMGTPSFTHQFRPVYPRPPHPFFLPPRAPYSQCMKNANPRFPPSLLDLRFPPALPVAPWCPIGIRPFMGSASTSIPSPCTNAVNYSPKENFEGKSQECTTAHSQLLQSNVNSKCETKEELIKCNNISNEMELPDAENVNKLTNNEFDKLKQADDITKLNENNLNPSGQGTNSKNNKTLPGCSSAIVADSSKKLSQSSTKLTVSATDSASALIENNAANPSPSIIRKELISTEKASVTKVEVAATKKKCKLHSHKPIPWPGIKQEPIDHDDTDSVMIPLVKIKQEPGTSVSKPPQKGLSFTNTVSHTTGLPKNITIKQEPGTSSGQIVKITDSTGRKQSLKRDISEVSGSKPPISKIIKLERNNNVSLRKNYPRSVVLNKSEQNDFEEVVSLKSTIKVQTQPAFLATTICSSMPVVSVSNASHVTTSTTASAISTTAKITSVGSALNSLSDACLSSTALALSSSIFSTPSHAHSTTSLSASSCNTGSQNSSADASIPNIDNLSQDSAPNAGIADTFFDLIYSDLAQSIPLQLKNFSPVLTDQQIVKVFGFCGQVLSSEPTLPGGNTSGSLVCIQGSFAGGLAVALLHEAHVADCKLVVQPHTEKAAAALQALPPEVLQSDAAFQCLEAMQLFLESEGLTFEPPLAYQHQHPDKDTDPRHVPPAQNSSEGSRAGTPCFSLCSSLAADAARKTNTIATSASVSVSACSDGSAQALSTTVATSCIPVVSSSAAITVQSNPTVSGDTAIVIKGLKSRKKGKRSKISKKKFVQKDCSSEVADSQNIVHQSLVRPTTRSMAKNTKVSGCKTKKGKTKSKNKAKKKVRGKLPPPSDKNGILSDCPQTTAVALAATSGAVAASVAVVDGHKISRPPVCSSKETAEQSSIEAASISMVDSSVSSASPATSAGADVNTILNTPCAKSGGFETPMQSANSNEEPVDVKPNVAELDKLIKRKCISSVDDSTSNPPNKSRSDKKKHRAKLLVTADSPCNLPVRIKTEPDDTCEEESCFPEFNFEGSPGRLEDRKPVVASAGDSVTPGSSSSRLSVEFTESVEPPATEQTTAPPHVDLEAGNTKLEMIETVPDSGTVTCSADVDTANQLSTELCEESQEQSHALHDIFDTGYQDYMGPSDVNDGMKYSNDISKESNSETAALDSKTSTQQTEFHIDLLAYKKRLCSVQWCRNPACSDYHDPADYIRDFYKYRGVKCREVFNSYCHRWRDPRACSKGSRCAFAHNQLEFLFHPANYKRFPCLSTDKYKAAACIFKQNCAFRHAAEEISRDEVMRQQKLFSELHNASGSGADEACDSMSSSAARNEGLASPDYGVVGPRVDPIQAVCEKEGGVASKDADTKGISDKIDSHRSVTASESDTVGVVHGDETLSNYARSSRSRKRRWEKNERFSSSKDDVKDSSQDERPTLKTVKKEPSCGNNNIVSQTEINKHYTAYKMNIVLPEECREITPVEEKQVVDSTSDLAGGISGTKIVEILQTLSDFSCHFGVMGALLPILHENAAALLKKGLEPLSVFEDTDNVTLITLLQQKIPKLKSSPPCDLLFVIKVELVLQLLIDEIENFSNKTSYLGLDTSAIARSTSGCSAEEISRFVRHILIHDGKPPPSPEQMHSIGMAVAAKHFKSSLNTNAFPVNRAREHFPSKQSFPRLPVKPFDRSYEQKKIASVTPSDVLPINSRADRESSVPGSSVHMDESRSATTSAAAGGVSELTSGWDVDLRSIRPTDLHSLEIRIPDVFGPATLNDEVKISSDQDMRVPLPAEPNLLTNQLSKATEQNQQAQNEHVTHETESFVSETVSSASFPKPGPSGNSRVLIWESPSFKDRLVVEDMAISEDDHDSAEEREFNQNSQDHYSERINSDGTWRTQETGVWIGIIPSSNAGDPTPSTRYPYKRKYESLAVDGLQDCPKNGSLTKHREFGHIAHFKDKQVESAIKKVEASTSLFKSDTDLRRNAHLNVPHKYPSEPNASRIHTSSNQLKKHEHYAHISTETGPVPICDVPKENTLTQLGSFPPNAQTICDASRSRTQSAEYAHSLARDTSSPLYSPVDNSGDMKVQTLKDMKNRDELHFYHPKEYSDQFSSDTLSRHSSVAQSMDSDARSQSFSHSFAQSKNHNLPFSSDILKPSTYSESCSKQTVPRNPYINPPPAFANSSRNPYSNSEPVESKVSNNFTLPPPPFLPTKLLNLGDILAPPVHTIGRENEVRDDKRAGEHYPVVKEPFSADDGSTSGKINVNRQSDIYSTDATNVSLRGLPSASSQQSNTFLTTNSSDKWFSERVSNSDLNFDIESSTKVVNSLKDSTDFIPNVGRVHEQRSQQTSLGNQILQTPVPPLSTPSENQSSIDCGRKYTEWKPLLPPPHILFSCSPLLRGTSFSSHNMLINKNGGSQTDNLPGCSKLSVAHTSPSQISHNRALDTVHSIPKERKAFVSQDTVQTSQKTDLIDSNSSMGKTLSNFESYSKTCSQILTIKDNRLQIINLSDRDCPPESFLNRNVNPSFAANSDSNFDSQKRFNSPVSLSSTLDHARNDGDKLNKIDKAHVVPPDSHTENSPLGAQNKSASNIVEHPSHDVFLSPLLVKPLFSPPRKEWKPPQRAIPPSSPWQSLSLKSNDFDFSHVNPCLDSNTTKVQSQPHIHQFLQNQSQLVQQCNIGSGFTRSKQPSSKTDANSCSRSITRSPSSSPNRLEINQDDDGSNSPCLSVPLECSPTPSLDATEFTSVDVESGNSCDSGNIVMDVDTVNAIISNRKVKENEPVSPNVGTSVVDTKLSLKNDDKNEDVKYMETKVEDAKDHSNEQVQDGSGESGMSLNFEDMVELLQNFTELESEEQIAFSGYLRNIKEREPHIIKRLYETANLKN